MKYTVYVDSNSSYMDETERYRLGEFEDREQAIGACKKVIDEFLLTSYRPGIQADEMFHQYLIYGDDPFIAGNEQGSIFSAMDYAKRRCTALCAD